MSTTGPDTHSSAFGDYEPANSFEARVVAVLDEVLHQLAALRADVSRLEAQVAANSAGVNATTNRMQYVVNKIDEVADTCKALAASAMIAQHEAEEAARDSRLSVDRIDEERRAAHRLGLEGKPIDELEIPEERPTDPHLGRRTDPPSQPPQ